MGFDLCRGDESFSWNIVAWPKLLGLAQRYGWKPAGTRSPKYYWLAQDPGDWEPPFDHNPADDYDPADWKGGYFSNDAQQVTAADALALAEALEKSLDDIPDCLDLPDKRIEASMVDREKLPAMQRSFVGLFSDMPGFIMPNANLNAYEFFGGETKANVIDFIAFCRHGEFYIL